MHTTNRLRKFAVATRQAGGHRKPGFSLISYNPRQPNFLHSFGSRLKSRLIFSRRRLLKATGSKIFNKLSYQTYTNYNYDHYASKIYFSLVTSLLLTESCVEIIEAYLKEKRKLIFEKLLIFLLTNLII